MERRGRGQKEKEMEPRSLASRSRRRRRYRPLSQRGIRALCLSRGTTSGPHNMQGAPEEDSGR